VRQVGQLPRIISNDFLNKILSFLNNVEKCGTAGQTTDYCKTAHSL